MVRRLLTGRATRYGAGIGFTFGALVFGGYAVAGAAFCVGLRTCPGSWVPYAIIVASGVAGFVVLSTLAAWLGAWIFRSYYRDEP